jgi:hypothetical protein
VRNTRANTLFLTAPGKRAGDDGYQYPLPEVQRQWRAMLAAMDATADDVLVFNTGAWWSLDPKSAQTRQMFTTLAQVVSECRRVH